MNNTTANLSGGSEESERECKRIFEERIPNVYSFLPFGWLTHQANPVAATEFKGFNELSTLT